MTDPSTGISNRGWNDPPKLQFNSGAQAPPKKQLTQRVTHILPSEKKSGTGQGDSTETSASRLTTSENPPPPPTDGPPIDAEGPSEGGDGSGPPAGNSSSLENTSQSEEERLNPTCEAVLSRLRGTTDECREKLKPRVLDDIKRKLEILEQAWIGGKLPAAVQSDMDKLSRAIMERRYDEANEVHLSLMLNHISVVGGWMVGIKRLISEARTILPPELDTTTAADQNGSCQATTVPLLLPVDAGAS